jgi:hypothetical protein
LLATYASVAAVTAASFLIGAAFVAASGWRRPSWLAPAVGLALLTALCWATVRLPGEGTTAAVLVLAAVLGSVAYLHRLAVGWREAVWEGLPVAALALAAASLPFAVEGRFGILGTSFNPDMSQHLLAAERLAEGTEGSLAAQGYPLGPHAITVALHDGLGIGLVQGFGGLTVATAVLAALAGFAALDRLDLGPRTLAALLVGLPYVVASYLAQGAFKETMEALFVLAFAVGLGQIARGGAWGGGRGRALVALPLAALAIGSVYTYSFPGPAWLAGTAAIWAAAELFARRHALGGAAAAARHAGPAAAVALAAFAVAVAPELGRMIDFGNFETFDPSGPGLGNLFHQVSPLEALGIWPSGDFRLDPGAGAVPALAFYAGAALGAVLLVWGLAELLRRGERALPAALAAAALAYLGSRIGGTPYNAAKAIAMLAPIAMLVILEPLLAALPAPLSPASLREALRPALAAAFVAAAGTCTVLALANAPVGPTAYSPALTSLRPTLGSQPTLVLAPSDLLDDEHGTPFLAWELRGGHVCIRAAGRPAARPPPAGIAFVIAPRGAGRPFAGTALQRRAGPYALWKRLGPAGGGSPCPLIEVRQARQGPA